MLDTAGSNRPTVEQDCAHLPRWQHLWEMYLRNGRKCWVSRSEGNKKEWEIACRKQGRENGGGVPDTRDGISLPLLKRPFWTKGKVWWERNSVEEELWADHNLPFAIPLAPLKVGNEELEMKEWKWALRSKRGAGGRKVLFKLVAYFFLAKSILLGNKCK